MIIYKLIVVFSVMAAAGAQMLLKKGAQQNYSSLIKQYLNSWVISGYFVMGLSLLINIYCLGHGVLVKEISIIESLSYLFVPLFALFFFKERISWRKIGAIGVIMIGVIVFFI